LESSRSAVDLELIGEHPATQEVVAMKHPLIIVLALAAAAHAEECAQAKDIYVLYRQDPKVNTTRVRVATFDATGASAASYNQMYCEFLRDKLLLPNQEIKYWCVPASARN
jgi:hypothetical protein